MHSYTVNLRLAYKSRNELEEGIRAAQLDCILEYLRTLLSRH